MKDGFIFAFWIYLEQNGPEYHPDIILINFDTTALVKVYLSSGSLFLLQDNAVVEQSGRIAEALPYQKWTFMSIIYVFGPTRNTIYVAQNCVQRELLVFPSLGREVNVSKISVTLGGGDFEPVRLPAKLAVSGLFPLSSKADVAELFGMGVRSTRTITFPYLKYFYDYGEMNSGKFTDVFVQQAGIDVLLPILTLKNYKFRSGGVFELDFPLFVTILCTVLGSSIHSHDGFHRSAGFCVLSH
jgi:hypothetical protein